MDSLLSDIDLADNIALLKEALRKQQEVTANLENSARKVGFKIMEKAKTITIGCDANTDSIIVDEKPAENVDQFQYLGSIITNDSKVEIEIRKE